MTGPLTLRSGAPIALRRAYKSSLRCDMASFFFSRRWCGLAGSRTPRPVKTTSGPYTPMVSRSGDWVSRRRICVLGSEERDEGDARAEKNDQQGTANEERLSRHGAACIRIPVPRADASTASGRALLGRSLSIVTHGHPETFLMCVSRLLAPGEQITIWRGQLPCIITHHSISSAPHTSTFMVVVRAS